MQEIETREQQIKQEQAGLSTTRYNLTQIIIESPMDGIVTRRNIEEGETAVVGTMNNAGSQLLTIADMSVIEAEVEVDETDIPFVALGQEAKVTIDAVEDRTFRGHVTEIGNSPIQANSQSGGQRQATTFKVVITLDEEVPEHPSRVHLHGRDHDGEDARTSRRCRSRRSPCAKCSSIRRARWCARRRRTSGGASNADTNTGPSDEPPPGHTRKETEGVFLVRDKQGGVHAGQDRRSPARQYFEVLDGLKAGDQVITGPFANVRELADGEEVRLQEESRNRRSRKHRPRAEQK